MLLAGETFPRCNECSFAVHFELVRAVPHAMNETDDFRIRLYELPHPDEEERQKNPRRIA